jgi:hypothetical protein
MFLVSVPFFDPRCFVISSSKSLLVALAAHVSLQIVTRSFGVLALLLASLVAGSSAGVGAAENRGVVLPLIY